MFLSLEKSLVMHVGCNQPMHSYHLQGNQLKTVDCCTDLGIIRSTNHGYRDYNGALSMKVSTTAEMLCRVFQSSSTQLLWLAFQSYVLPMLVYCSPAWCPNLQADIGKLEFSDALLNGLHDLPYNDRLQSLGALSLHTRRHYSEMIIVYKALHGLININPTDIGLSIISSSTTGAGIKISQRLIRSKYHASYFACRAPVEGNGLFLFAKQNYLI